MTRLVYVATPMDLANTRTYVGVNQLMSKLRGFYTFSPAEAWGGKVEDNVQDHNLVMVSRSALVLAMWDGTPSTGVPLEVGYALGQGIPVLIVKPEDHAYGGEVQFPTAYRNLPVCGLLDLTTVLTYMLEQTDPSVKVVLQDGATLPTRSYHGDAGFDLYTLNDTTIAPKTTVNVHTGVFLEFPNHVWGMLIGRSSSHVSKNLQVHPAVIDQGYRGEMFVSVRNMGLSVYTVRAGERLAQFIPMPLLAAAVGVRQVSVLSPSDRNERGFGSSGR